MGKRTNSREALEEEMTFDLTVKDGQEFVRWKVEGKHVPGIGAAWREW